MPRDSDPLRRKWKWMQTQWEVTKELGLMDDSRKQPVVPPVVDGRRADEAVQRLKITETGAKAEEGKPS